MGSLTSTQHAVLVGSLLGDGTLRRQGKRVNALFEVNHCFAAKEYVDWKYTVFQSFVLTPPKCRQGNGSRVAYRFTTQSNSIFSEYYRWFYSDRVKRIPVDLELDPLILAVWFMDDGSKSRSSCYLNTQQFCWEDQITLQTLLKKKFGIVSSLNRDKEYFRIRVSTESTKVLRELVRPYVIPYFKYKLGNDPVTTDPKGKALREISHCNTPTLINP